MVLVLFGSGFRGCGSGVSVQGSGFRGLVSDASYFRVQGSRVWGVGFRARFRAAAIRRPPAHWSIPR